MKGAGAHGSPSHPNRSGSRGQDVKSRTKGHLQRPSLNYLLLPAGPRVSKVFTASQSENTNWEPGIENPSLWERCPIQTKTLSA